MLFKSLISTFILLIGFNSAFSQDYLELVSKKQSTGIEESCFMQYVDNATVLFDASLDAMKIFANSTSIAEIGMQLNDTVYLAINSLDVDSIGPVTWPVKVKVLSSDTCYLYLASPENGMSDRSCVFLEDMLLDSMIDLRSGVQYQYYQASSTDTSRFLLHVSGQTSSDSLDATCFGTQDGMVTALGSGHSTLTYTWTKDGAAYETNQVNGPDTLYNIGAGVYRVTITQDTGCLSPIFEFNVAQFDTVTWTEQWNSVTCFGDEDGLVSVTGATTAYSYLWQDGSTVASHTGLSAGAWAVTISDTTGCAGSTSFTISEPTSIFTSLLGVADTLLMIDDSLGVQFNSFASGGDQYDWTFGDGAVLTEVEASDPLHYYQDTGHYQVVFIGTNNGSCTESDTLNFYIEQFISSIYEPANFRTVLVNNTPYRMEGDRFRLFDLKGSVLSTSRASFSGIPPGVYLVVGYKREERLSARKILVR